MLYWGSIHKPKCGISNSHAEVRRAMGSSNCQKSNIGNTTKTYSSDKHVRIFVLIKYLDAAKCSLYKLS